MTTREKSFLPADLTPRPRHSKMAQANRNWRIFRAHEIAIRTAVNQPLAQAELDAERGWSRIVDKRAYVECLKDITVARQVYDSSYQQVRGLYSNGLVPVPP
jgi:hypothetical protein